MPLTLGLTGMDPATETVLKTAFEKANASLGNRFTLAGESDAKYVIVDMDSMYGPMSWLRLHGADKVVIGLTSAPRTQTDFRLARPFDADAVTALLHDLADKAGISLESAPAAPAPVAAKAPAAAPPPLPAASPSGLTPAPAPQDELPKEHLQPTNPESRPPLQAPVLAPTPTVAVTSAAVSPPSMKPAAPAAPVVAAAPPAMPEPTPEPAPAPPPPAPKDRTLADWLAPGVLVGRVRYVHAGCPELLIDAGTRQYHGPPTLKPLQPCFEGAVERDAFVAMDDASWKTAVAKLGDAQPLPRLQWYGALVAGQGGAALDMTLRYRLSKWPQTEREFPKHFRIATVMMKGPATIDEIANAANLTQAEVADFINANLMTGYAELIPDAPPESSEPTPKPSGILGRLRGR